MDAGDSHSCAILPEGRVRCWGFNANGQLGYGNETTIGDDEAPGSAGPVDLGAGRTATVLGIGNFHGCAVLDNGSVRCWGSGLQGQLGRLMNFSDVGDNETPASVPPVDLGAGRTARAVTAGGGHNCALLADNNVLCWGYGFRGRLGYGNQDNVGLVQSPGSVGPVNLGAGRTAAAVSAGHDHTCALLDNHQVRCWGDGTFGRLGYGNTQSIGDNLNETPGTVAPVDLGPGRTAVAISAGGSHSCAVLDNGSVRCWGAGSNGQLGYGDVNAIGDNETPGSVTPVDLGAGHTATAIAAGPGHTCAVLDDGTLRCWGLGDSGQLGLGNLQSVGDNETPASVPAVDVGAGRSVLAVALGARHTCARLDDSSVRCWGSAGSGRLGYCSLEDIGDDEVPGSAGPVALVTRSGGGCIGASPATPRPAPRYDVGPGASLAAALRAQASRRRSLLSCRSRARRHAARETRRARRLSGSGRARARRHIRTHRRRLLRACLRRYGRTPGRVSRVQARPLSRTKLELSFGAAGTDADRPPAAQSYVVRQSRRPIRSARGFRRAQALCNGRCRFPSITTVGAKLTITVSDLRPATTYYYAVAARDNVSGRLGRRSQTVRVRTPG